jgi:class 3 adenylate cyclase
VTVVCAAFDIQAADGSSLDPEELRDAAARAVGEIRAAVDRHEGTVVASSGDTVTAIFGIPSVHEGDAAAGARGSPRRRTARPDASVIRLHA